MRDNPVDSVIPEGPALASTGSIDLQRFAAGARRRLWSQWVPDVFGGVEVQDLSPDPIGICRRIMVASTPVYSVMTTSQKLVGRRPVDPIVPRSGLIVQVDGVNEIEQDGRRCRLTAGHMCVVDGTRRFVIEAPGVSKCHVVHIEHYLAQTHFPDHLRQSATRFDHESPEARLLRQFLEIVVETGEGLSPAGGSAALAALLRLIGGVPVPRNFIHRQIPRRVKQALDDIEAMVSDPALTPDRLARGQGVSRRRLDLLVVEATGWTLSAHISERRLTEAAALLCDPSQAHRSITDIAHDTGFQDSAHFSRSFRRRFHVTPRQWRASPDNHLQF